MSNSSQKPQRVRLMWSHFPYVGIYVSLFLALAILAVYLLKYSALEFNSDNDSLLALSMRDQGTIFPKGWIVANDDFMIPSTAIMIYFLTQWMPNGFPAYSIAISFLAAALISGIAYFLRSARLSWPATAVVLLLVASGFSRGFIVMTYVEGAYIWWPLAFFVLAGLATSHASCEGGRRGGWLLALLFGATLLIGMKNPARVAIMTVVPFLVFNRTLARFGRKDLENGAVLEKGIFGSAWGRELAALSGLALAYVIVKLLLHYGVIFSHQAATRLTLVGFDGFVDHLKIFANGWFDYFGAHDEEHAAQGLEPLFRTFRTMLAVALTCVPVLEIRDRRATLNPVRRALLYAFFAALIPILTIYLAFDPLAKDYLTSRYFTLPYLLIAALAGWRVNDLLSSGTFARSCIVACSFMVVLSCVQRMIPLDNSAAARKSKPEILGQTLRNENLKYGYATWWNAGATTTMADSAVRVYPITPSPDGIAPHPVWIDKKWYDESSHVGPTFLILDDGEASPAMLDLLGRTLGAPVRTIVVAGSRIFVYDYNIARTFSCALFDVAIDAPLDDKSISSIKMLDADVSAYRGTHNLGVRLSLTNTGSKPVSSVGKYPVTIGLQLFDTGGHMLNHDFLHAPLNCTLYPGQTRSMNIITPELKPGEYRIDFDLVQEGITWFSEKGATPMRKEIVVPE